MAGLALLQPFGCAAPGGSAPPAAGPIRGASGAFELRPPGPGWVRVPAGSLAQGADLELGRSDGGTSVAVWRHGGAGRRLEDVVAHRRGLILGQPITDFREKRYFLDAESLAPTSLARYAAGGHVYLVFTTVGPRETIEALAVVVSAGGREREVLELFESFRFVGEEAGP